LLQEGEVVTAQQLLNRCLEYWRGEGNEAQIAKELNSLGISYRHTGDWHKARELFDEGLAVAEHSGDKSRFATILSNRAILETDVGEPTVAIPLLDRAVAIDRHLGDSWAEACDRVNLAAARLLAGEPERADQELGGVAQSALAVNDIDLTINLIELLAMVRAEVGDVSTSARLSGTADTLREQANLPRPPPDATHLSHSLAKSRQAVEEKAWSGYVTEGRAMSPEDAIAEGIRVRPDLP